MEPENYGPSLLTAAYRQQWYAEVLRRYNDAIALDSVIPFTVLTRKPKPATGGSPDGPSIANER